MNRALLILLTVVVLTACGKKEDARSAMHLAIRDCADESVTYTYNNDGNEIVFTMKCKKEKS